MFLDTVDSDTTNQYKYLDKDKTECVNNNKNTNSTLLWSSGPYHTPPMQCWHPSQAADSPPTQRWRPSHAAKKPPLQ